MATLPKKKPILLTKEREHTERSTFKEQFIFSLFFNNIVVS